MVQPLLLLIGDVGQLAAFLGGLFRLLVHTLDKIVGIYHCPLAGLHLAFGKFHHAVGKVVDLVRPGKSQFLQDELEDLEVVVLLVAHDIHVGIQVVFGKPALGRAQVLGDIDRGTVAAEDELAVQAVAREVAPDGAVGLAEEDTLVQSLLDQFLAQEVRLGLMVHLVEGDAQGGVGLVEAGIHPAVHHGPERPDVGIVLLPLHEHLVGLFQGGGGLLGLVLGHALFHQLLDLGLVHLVEGHVAVAHQVVALDAGGFRGLSLELLLPGQHGLADMDTAVVHDRGLDDLVAAGLEET